MGGERVPDWGPLEPGEVEFEKPQGDQRGRQELGSEFGGFDKVGFYSRLSEKPSRVVQMLRPTW